MITDTQYCIVSSCQHRRRPSAPRQRWGWAGGNEGISHTIYLIKRQPRAHFVPVIALLYPG